MMRVKKKVGRAEFNVVEESEGFYVVENYTGFHRWAVPKSDYEPIPASPTWRDVTAECEAVKDQACTVYGEGPDFPLLQVKVYRPGTYRLVKTEQGFRVERKDP